MTTAFLTLKSEKKNQNVSSRKSRKREKSENELPENLPGYISERTDFWMFYKCGAGKIAGGSYL